MEPLKLNNIFDYKVLGGGYIENKFDNKIIKVFGECCDFGVCDHSRTLNLLKMRFPTFDIKVYEDPLDAAPSDY